LTAEVTASSRLRDFRVTISAWLKLLGYCAVDSEAGKHSLLVIHKPKIL